MFQKYPNKTKFIVGIVLILAEYVSVVNHNALGDIIEAILFVAGMYLILTATISSLKQRRAK